MIKQMKHSLGSESPIGMSLPPSFAAFVDEVS